MVGRAVEAGWEVKMVVLWGLAEVYHVSLEVAVEAGWAVEAVGSPGLYPSSSELAVPAD